jgi:phosphotransferase system enzyme I (PtsI)
LNDEFFILPIKKDIKIGVNPIEAVKKSAAKFHQVLSGNKDEYLKQRANDIIHISDMIIDSMCDKKEIDLKEKVILVADDLSPADTIMLDESKILGIVTLNGGITSHTVILAKSMGIPAIVGIKTFDEELSGEFGYLDATSGKLLINLNNNEINEYEKLIEEEEKLKKYIEEYSCLECQTMDGEEISVYGNIGSLKEIDEKINFDGIGLFRTEFLYSSKNKKISLDEQIDIYKKLSDLVGDRPVTIRTLDVGGDKNISYLNLKEEENPFLGNRGIRLCLNSKTILFEEQIKAILIAFNNRSVNLLIPMVTVIEEIRQVKQIIDNVKTRLSEENISFCRDVKLGIMIETPASAICSDLFAKECDFFSLGTNDLTQYVMATDRGNEDVSYLYYSYNSSVLRLIKYVIDIGKKNNIPVSVCGDVAANFSMTKVLIGMGLKKFSVPFKLINKLKYTISKITLCESKSLADTLLNCTDRDEAEDIIFP